MALLLWFSPENVCLQALVVIHMTGQHLISLKQKPVEQITKPSKQETYGWVGTEGVPQIFSFWIKNWFVQNFFHKTRIEIRFLNRSESVCTNLNRPVFCSILSLISSAMTSETQSKAFFLHSSFLKIIFRLSLMTSIFVFDTPLAFLLVIETN